MNYKPFYWIVVGLLGVALIASPRLQTFALVVTTAVFLLAVALTSGMLLIALLRGSRR